MGRWRGKGRRTWAPEQWLGSATRFAAGRGAYGKNALPAWATDPTDEQPTVDPWRAAAVPAESADQTDPDSGDSDNGDKDTADPQPAPPNRSIRFRTECGADRGYPPGWR